MEEGPGRGPGRGKAFCRGEAWGQMQARGRDYGLILECVCMAERSLLYNSCVLDTALFLGFM